MNEFATPIATVFVVDDDDAVRHALARMLGVAGFKVEVYDCAEAFLEKFDPDRPGCLILDVRMPGMDGTELQKKLIERPIAPPVIMLTAHGDVPMAVEAVQDGAVDFVEKPFKKQRLLELVERAVELDTERRRLFAKTAEIRGRFETLTPREREVLNLLVEGLAVKQIAGRLGTNRNTVKHQRASVLRKMQAASEVELVKAVEALNADERT